MWAQSEEPVGAGSQYVAGDLFDGVSLEDRVFFKSPGMALLLYSERGPYNIDNFYHNRLVELT